MACQERNERGSSPQYVADRCRHFDGGAAWGQRGQYVWARDDLFRTHGEGTRRIANTYARRRLKICDWTNCIYEDSHRKVVPNNAVDA
jgi:hypothetical protein